MRKFKYGQLAIGLVSGIILATSTGAYASVGDKLEAVVTHFNFVVNGKQVAIDTPIVTIADSSYLPVRTISNILGYDITYKADSRTIELTVGGNVYAPSPSPTATPQTTPQLPSTTKQLETVVINGITYFNLTEYIIHHNGESGNWVYDDQNHRYIYAPSSTTIDLNIAENGIIQNGYSYINIKFLPNN